MLFALTVTVVVAILSPDCAEIVAVPGFLPVTSPSLSTVATAGLSDFHVRAAFLGLRLIGAIVTFLPRSTDTVSGSDSSVA